jgi:hypothetical protein
MGTTWQNDATSTGVVTNNNNNDGGLFIEEFS